MSLKSKIINSVATAFIVCIEFLHIIFAGFSIIIGLFYLIVILLGGLPTGLGAPTLPDLLLPISFLAFLIAAIKKYVIS